MNDSTLITSTGTDIATRDAAPPALQNAIGMWADATTDAASRRRVDLLRDKTRAVQTFFQHCQKPLQQVTPLDVKTWQAHLETALSKRTGKPLSPAAVYAMISKVSSFYRWAMQAPELAAAIRQNPVDLARPKAPQPYTTDAAKALDTADAAELLRVVRSGRGIHHKRDYALLLFYLETGMRRSEILRLRWMDVQLNGTITIRTRIKGGKIRNRRVDAPAVKAALLDYLNASGRLQGMEPDAPLWTSHDRSGTNTGKPLTGHAFSKNLKRYAHLAGLDHIHVHQLRHTAGKLVAEQTGSITDTQEFLCHADVNTTKTWYANVETQSDKHGAAVLAALGVE